MRPTLAVSLSMQHNKALDKELSAIRRFLLPRWQEKHAMYEKLGVAVKGGPFATPDKSMCKFTSVFGNGATRTWSCGCRISNGTCRQREGAL